MEQEDLGHLRKSYQKGALNIDDIQNDPMIFFKNWFDQANETQTIEEANAMTLSTLGLDDFPKSRIVLLKALIDEGFVFFPTIKVKKEHPLLTTLR